MKKDISRITIIMLICLATYTQINMLDNAMGFLIYEEAQIETDQKLYYPNETISIICNWSLYINNEEEVNISLVFLDGHPDTYGSTEEMLGNSLNQIKTTGEIIEMTDGEINQANNKQFEVNSSDLFPVLQGEFNNSKKIGLYICLCFYEVPFNPTNEYVSDPAYINLTKFTPEFLEIKAEEYAVELGNSFNYNNTICANESPNLFYGKNSLNLTLQEVDIDWEKYPERIPIMITKNIEIDKGKFNLSISSEVLNRTGHYNLSLTIERNTFFQRRTVNLSLRVSWTNATIHILNNSLAEPIPIRNGSITLLAETKNEREKKTYIFDADWIFHSDKLEILDFNYTEDAILSISINNSVEPGIHTLKINASSSDYNFSQVLVTLHFIQTVQFNLQNNTDKPVHLDEFQLDHFDYVFKIENEGTIFEIADDIQWKYGNTTTGKSVQITDLNYQDSFLCITISLPDSTGIYSFFLNATSENYNFTQEEIIFRCIENATIVGLNDTNQPFQIYDGKFSLLYNIENLNGELINPTNLNLIFNDLPEITNISIIEIMFGDDRILHLTLNFPYSVGIFGFSFNATSDFLQFQEKYIELLFIENCAVKINNNSLNSLNFKEGIFYLNITLLENEGTKVDLEEITWNIDDIEGTKKIETFSYPTSQNQDNYYIMEINYPSEPGKYGLSINASALYHIFSPIEINLEFIEPDGADNENNSISNPQDENELGEGKDNSGEGESNLENGDNDESIDTTMGGVILFSSILGIATTYYMVKDKHLFRKSS